MRSTGLDKTTGTWTIDDDGYLIDSGGNAFNLADAADLLTDYGKSYDGLVAERDALRAALLGYERAYIEYAGCDGASLDGLGDASIKACAALALSDGAK